MKKYFFPVFIIIVSALIFFRWLIIHKKVYTYVALGDSYTIGEGVSTHERWPDQLVQRLNESGITLKLLLNPSVTGYTTLDVIEKELPLLVDTTPDIITLQIGVNDFFRGVTLEEFSLRYTRLIREIRQKCPNSRLVLVNIPDYGKTPYGSQTGDPMNIYRGILLYNARIRNIAEEYHLPIVDIFDLSLLVAEDPSLISSDGLHPSAKQYALWVDRMVPRVMDTLSSF